MTYYLTRAVINRQAPEHSLRPLLDPADTSMVLDAHRRLIWTLFPGNDAKRDFLWRADGSGKFLIVSARRPQPSRLFQPIESKPYAPVLAPGDRLAFVLRANATKDRRCAPKEEAAPGTARRPRHDRRVDIVMHAMREQEADGNEEGDGRASRRIEAAVTVAKFWLARQGESRGFLVETSAVEDYRVSVLRRRGGKMATFGILDLKGVLTIRDPEEFARTLFTGLGRARAFGCGLILVRRA